MLLLLAHGAASDVLDEDLLEAGLGDLEQGDSIAELHVPAEREPESILREALTRGERVTLFEIVDPSLEEVFVEHVGRRATPDEERHLAGSAGGGQQDPAHR